MGKLMAKTEKNIKNLEECMLHDFLLARSTNVIYFYRLESDLVKLKLGCIKQVIKIVLNPLNEMKHLFIVVFVLVSLTEYCMSKL